MNAKREKLLFSLSFCASLFFLNISLSGQSVSSAAPLDSLVKSYNKVGFDIFKECYEQLEVDSNLLISPYSISVAMSMVYIGANGTTKEEMQDVLHLNGLSDASISQSNSDILDSLQTSDKDTIHIANSIWHRDDISLVDDFLNICTDKYQSQVRALDFSNPASKDIINKWVNDNTGEKIPEIIDEIDPISVLFIINALYFKGTWKKIFDENATADADFALSSGTEIQVPTMIQMDTFNVIQNNKIEAVELPFSDNKYSMIILLPKTNYGIDSLISNIDHETWKQWESEFYEHAVQIYLPKFRFDYSNDLVGEFDSLGMKQAFGSADFTNLYAPGGIWIDKINHKTAIDVNEKGAEAAAATEVEFIWGDNPILFEANRPFVFMIKNNEIDVILFLGKVGKPVYKDIIKIDYDHISNNITNSKIKESYDFYYDSQNQSIELLPKKNTSGFDNLKIDLIDLSGRLVKSWSINEPISNRLSLKIPDLYSNIYLIRINNREAIQTRKIIVN